VGALTDYFKLVIVLVITAILIVIGVNAFMDMRQEADTGSEPADVGSIRSGILEPGRDTPTATPFPYDEGRVFVLDRVNQTWVLLDDFNCNEPFYLPSLGGPTAPPTATPPPWFPPPVSTPSPTAFPIELPYFEDGFESGTTDAWSWVSPDPSPTRAKNLTNGSAKPPQSVVSVTTGQDGGNRTNITVTPTATAGPQDANQTNITITPTPEGILFPDEFESGTTNAWSNFVPCICGISNERIKLPGYVLYCWDAIVVPLDVYRADSNGTRECSLTSRVVSGSDFSYGVSSSTIAFEDKDNAEPLFIWVFPNEATSDEIALQFLIGDSNVSARGAYDTYNLSIRFVSPEAPTAPPVETTPTPTPTITPVPSYVATPTPEATPVPDETMKEIISVYVFYTTSDGIVTGVAEVPVYVKDALNGGIVYSGFTDATGYFTSKELPSADYVLEGGEGWTKFGPRIIPIFIGHMYQEFEVTPPRA
jgi:hypothetical protein